MSSFPTSVGKSGDSSGAGKAEAPTSAAPVGPTSPAEAPTNAAPVDIGIVGRGGMGEVYRADDLKLGQAVALKFLPEKLAQDTDRRERLFEEVRTARKVSHPNVCRVWDIGEADGHQFISMEFVDGEDLASLLRRIGRNLLIGILGGITLTTAGAAFGMGLAMGGLSEIPPQVRFGTILLGVAPTQGIGVVA